MKAPRLIASLMFVVLADPSWGGAAESAPTPPVLIAAPSLGVAIGAVDVQSELDALSDMARQQSESDPAMLAQVINDLYRRRVLLTQARVAGLEDDPAVRARVARYEEEALVEALTNQKRRQLLEAAPDFGGRAREFYAAHPERYTAPARTEVRHILLRAPTDDAKRQRAEQAAQVLERLNRGEPFEAVAREVSEDASAQNGGLLPPFVAGQMVPEFEAAALALEGPGAISGVVETTFGLHVIQLESRSTERRAPFEEVRDAIVSKLRRDWVASAFEAWRQELVDPARAEVDTQAINRLILETTGKELPPPVKAPQ